MRHVDKELEDVRRFAIKFGLIQNVVPGLLTKRKLNERLECMQEELEEFAEACEGQDIAGQADALIDLVYFAKGTAAMLGLPWADLWDDVQACNMKKVRGVKKERGHLVDLVKPADWEPPHTMRILFEAGYDPRNFFNPDGSVKTEELRDDQEHLPDNNL